MLTEYVSEADIQLIVKPTDRMTVPTGAAWEMLATYFVALNAASVPEIVPRNGNEEY